jgi:tetratricopeptide (TPR) repeat protein
MISSFRRRSVAALLSIVLPAIAALPATAREAPSRGAKTDGLAGAYLAAIVAGADRDTANAARYFRQALTLDQNSEELAERAFVTLLADGAMGEAAKLGERVLRRDPGNTLAQLVLGVREIRAKRYGESRRFLVKGGRGRAADVTATLLNAWSLAGSRDFKGAIQTVDRLKGEDSFNAFRDMHAGLIAELGRQPQEAARRMLSAYTADRRMLRTIDVYGRFLARNGDAAGAIEVYETFDKLLPRNPVVMDALATLRGGKPLDGTPMDVSRGAAEALYMLGAVGSREGDEIASIIYLRLALWLAPDHELALITLADAYDRLKQWETSNGIYGRVPPASPLYRSAQVQIGVNLEQLDRGEEAVAHLKAAAERWPEDIEALTSLGNVYRSRKAFAEAVEAYDRALAGVKDPDPGHWTLFYFRGIALERTKRWPRAEADFRKALELQPDQPLVLNYLGYSWVDQGVNLEEAFRMLRRAVEQRPRDGYIVDSLGWAYFRLGRFEEAVRILERAVELRPADPVINDHLGDAYWKVGRRLEARFQWNHARDLKPEPEDLEKILRKLAEGLPDAPVRAEPAKAGDGG